MNVLTLSAQMIRNADFKFANVCTFSDILIVNYVILKLSNDTLSWEQSIYLDFPRKHSLNGFTHTNSGGYTRLNDALYMCRIQFKNMH